ncbi:hypothetical protein Pyn_38275 [Prunus yedoensis var. nudiflora]|uniref:Uncharacterized protein n=1 Tax=Prunus yedoensis var. nudiflora TaxID=2094558 RepID=A0A314ZW76_PRUYE|nr:hypothetical protein Pyn_38275 [Prunus yedoensis var. nudiflora]
MIVQRTPIDLYPTSYPDKRLRTAKGGNNKHMVEKGRAYLPSAFSRYFKWDVLVEAGQEVKRVPPKYARINRCERMRSGVAGIYLSCKLWP